MSIALLACLVGVVLVVPALAIPAATADYYVPVRQPRETSIDVCQGRLVFCVNETVVQRCQQIGETDFEQIGNPLLCAAGEVCNETSTGGCSKPPPFSCTANGYFAGRPGCSKYHVCAISANQVQHTTITCTEGQVYSCAHKKCVATSIASGGCDQCKQS